MTEPSPPTSKREPGRHSHLRRNLTITGVLLVALALLVGGAVQLVLPMFSSDDTMRDYPGPGSGHVDVVIVDAAPEAIGTTLVEADVVATVEAFVDAYGENPAATGIQPGAYSLAKQMTAADAVVALLDPANRTDRNLTIPPGWRASQILAKVSEVMGVPLADVDAAAQQLDLPHAADGQIEGWLFADSYTIGPADEVQDVLQEMVDRTVEVQNMHEVTKEDRESVLTQASIVEAEVSSAEDRGKVARVMQNRLNGCADVGEYLQMNSTVAYGLGKSVTDLTLADLEDDSTPYNTYVFEGLPPTPINSPSVESMEAVLAPPEGDWCYFVTVNLETGETRFTDDPAEHEQNKAAYREWLAQWREEQSAAAEDATTDGEG